MNDMENEYTIRNRINSLSCISFGVIDFHEKEIEELYDSDDDYNKRYVKIQTIINKIFKSCLFYADKKIGDFNEPENRGECLTSIDSILSALKDLIEMENYSNRDLLIDADVLKFLNLIKNDLMNWNPETDNKEKVEKWKEISTLADKKSFCVSFLPWDWMDIDCCNNFQLGMHNYYNDFMDIKKDFNMSQIGDANNAVQLSEETLKKALTYFLKYAGIGCGNWSSIRDMLCAVLEDEKIKKIMFSDNKYNEEMAAEQSKRIIGNIENNTLGFYEQSVKLIANFRNCLSHDRKFRITKEEAYPVIEATRVIFSLLIFLYSHLNTRETQE